MPLVRQACALGEYINRVSSMSQDQNARSGDALAAGEPSGFSGFMASVLVADESSDMKLAASNSMPGSELSMSFEEVGILRSVRRSEISRSLYTSLGYKRCDSIASVECPSAEETSQRSSPWIWNSMWIG